jgi:hypothetical protein
MCGRRPIAGPVLRARVDRTVEIVMPEIPRLSGKDQHPAPGARDDIAAVEHLLPLLAEQLVLVAVATVCSRRTLTLARVADSATSLECSLLAWRAVVVPLRDCRLTALHAHALAPSLPVLLALSLKPCISVGRVVGSISSALAFPAPDHEAVSTRPICLKRLGCLDFTAR